VPLTRTDFQQLADIRAAEATALLAAGCWDGAYYLAGYAVECALKACVAKLTVAEEFPDKERAYKAFTHDIEQLVKLAQLKDVRDTDAKADPEFRGNWNLVKDWAEDSRYARWTEQQARAIHSAVTDPAHGVLPWIKRQW
jgi:HEPN domain-containing protein